MVSDLDYREDKIRFLERYLTFSIESRNRIKKGDCLLSFIQNEISIEKESLDKKKINSMEDQLFKNIEEIIHEFSEILKWRRP
jgi:hypothetical protein